VTTILSRNTLESVDLDDSIAISGSVRGGKIPLLQAESCGKKLENFVTLITLKLDNLSQFFAFNNSSVACEIL